MPEIDEAFPVRLPVWWGRRGAAGPHPELPGVTGRFVVIRHAKRFGRLEGLLARLFRAPGELRRPLDDMNSLLWELCDGTRDFSTLCRLLDDTFHERIAPVEERTAAALARLNQLGLVGLSTTSFEGDWPLGPGIDPSGDLEPPDPRLDLEW